MSEVVPSQFDPSHTYTLKDFPLLNPYFYRSIGYGIMDFDITPYLQLMNDPTAALEKRTEAFDAAQYTESFAHSYYARNHKALEATLDRPMTAAEKKQHNRVKTAAEFDVHAKMSSPSSSEWDSVIATQSWNSFATARTQELSSKLSKLAFEREAKKRSKRK